MQDIKKLAEAADELGKLTEKPWSQSEVLHYCSQKLIPLLAKVAILEEDIDAVRVQSKSAKWRNTIWQDAYGRWNAYVPIKPEASWLLRQDGVARIKHPADGARAWPVREMLVNLEQVRVDTQTIHRIKSTFHQPIADPAQTATTAPMVTESVPGGAPMLKQPAQEARILELLTSKGHDPLNLADRPPGGRGAKHEIRALALLEPALFTKKTFDTAWQRLREDDRLVGGD